MSISLLSLLLTAAATTAAPADHLQGEVSIRNISYFSEVSDGAISACGIAFTLQFRETGLKNPLEEALFGKITFFRSQKSLAAKLSARLVNADNIKADIGVVEDAALRVGDVSISTAADACDNEQFCGVIAPDQVPLLAASEDKDMLLTFQNSETGRLVDLPFALKPDPTESPALWLAGKAVHDDCMASLRASVAREQR